MSDFQEPVEESEHELYPGKVESQISNEVLYQPQAYEVFFRVETQHADCTGRVEKANTLVLPQRLGMHLQDAGGDADDVDALSFYVASIDGGDHLTFGPLPAFYRSSCQDSRT